MNSLIFDLLLLEQAQAQAHVLVNEAILRLEKGACGYYAFDVAEGDKQLPETETSSTIRAYGNGASTIYLDVSLVGNQRTFTIVNDSSSQLVIKASDDGQTVTVPSASVKKIVRMNDDIVEIVSLDKSSTSVGIDAYYAFNVAEGDIQLPTTETSSTIRAYGTGASEITLDISLTGNQRAIVIANDSTSKLVVKASDTGQAVTIYPSGVKKIARMNEDVVKLASLIGTKAEDVSLLYDWNMVLDTGFYRGTGMLNKPTDSGYWQYCMVIQHDPSFVVQLLFDLGSSQGGTNGVWVRWCESSSWSAWKTFALI